MNANDIEHWLNKHNSKGRGFTHDRCEAIGFIFRCDMKTAQNIVDRIGAKLGIGTDPIVVLKIAGPLLICECIVEELKTDTN